MDVVAQNVHATPAITMYVHRAAINILGKYTFALRGRGYERTYEHERSHGRQGNTKEA